MKRIIVGLVMFLGFVGVAFAGPFSGVGGDADYFPKNGPIGSFFLVPMLNLESTSASSIYGLEGVIGWSDLSFSIKYGKQGDSNFTGLGIRKKILGEDNMPFSCALIYDVDGILAQNSSVNGSYLGAIFSKKIDNLFPYIAILSTTYYTSANVGGTTVWNYIYGTGLAGGVRYDYSDNWAIKGELNYNILSTTASMPSPKSVM
ncbi:MAG: hypothetical protein WCW67_08420, partial [Candidatus Margulisiibacteriota bacterium]